MRLTMDRRRFAALAGTAAASGAILGLAACSHPDAQSDKTAFSDTGDGAIPEVAQNGTWVNSTCQGCTSWCSVRVYVEDGRAVKLSGNPKSLSNRGFICPRPHLAVQQVYDPDRIKVPLKRTNPKKGRGEDPGFVAISWDAAFNTIADKLMELRAANETH